MEILEKESLEEYKAFVASHPKGHFMQSPEWGDVKTGWSWKAVVERDGAGKIIGGLSILIRRLPVLPYTLMYAPRGPVCDVDDEKTITALTQGVRLLARKYKAYQFKIDPDISVADTAFPAIMNKLGFKHVGGGKNFDEIQPRYVFRLNVAGKSEEELLASFHSKTRYNIRVAVKKGVQVKIRGKEALDEFLPIMRETGLRDGFATRPKEYFERMMDILGDHCRLYMAYYDGNPVAGTIATQYGDKTWYLYGASSNHYRSIMPNYLLQWEMIRWALEGGCRIYDFRGVSGDLSESNPLYGLYRFKKGFNGDFTEFVGEFDLILNKPVSRAVDIGLKLLKECRRLKNRRHSAAEAATTAGSN